MEKKIEVEIKKSAKIINESVNLSPLIKKAIRYIIDCIRNGNKVILFGNGGSAADAQHIAAELIGRYKKNRKSYPAIALTSNTSVITAIGNDFSFDNIFSRQCDSLVKPNDVVIGISTSGNSKNVRNGLIKAKKNHAITIGLLGNNGGIIKKNVDLAIIINASSTPHVQEVHRVIVHIICNIVEKELSS